MKFCKDCKWFKVPLWHECTNPKAVITNMTDGSQTLPFAENVRRLVKECGPTAKWFEEKERVIPLCGMCQWGVPMGAFHGSLCSKDICARFTSIVRYDESLCGKYGKWFEKKEEPRQNSIIGYAQKNLKPGDMVGYTFGGALILDTSKIGEKPPLKKQSWICKLICGVKK